MSLRPLPAIKAFERPTNYDGAPSIDALNRWNGGLRVANAQAGVVIDIFDVIGVDWWTGEGITAKSISEAVHGAGDITVNINSPGGDFFEGLAIYTILRNHPAHVDVNVIGYAASAASLIAMAGDKIRIAKSALMMIHNAWGVVVGNRHDMASAAETFAKFDESLVIAYQARSGKDAAEIGALMDAETWLLGQEAIDAGFADELLAADAVIEDPAAKARAEPVSALRVVDGILSAHMPRSKARGLIKQVTGGKPGAAATEPMPGAGLKDVLAGLERLTANFKS